MFKYAIPNLITFSRIVLTIVFLVFLNRLTDLKTNDSLLIYLNTIFCIICLTDFLDGKTARYLNACSLFGSTFDVLADFIFILFSIIILSKHGLIPWWFNVVIIAKLLEFIITSKIISNSSDERRNFIFDTIGRLAAVLFYILPITTIIVHRIFFHASSLIITLIIYINIVLAIISTVLRIMSCIGFKKSVTVT